MRFALQRERASIGAMAQHISGAYAIHLRHRRGWTGRVFSHYMATPVDADLFLDDLVIWLHRPPESAEPSQAGRHSCWTADFAYLVPNSSSWVTTDCVLSALSRGGAGRSAYRRRKTQPLTPEVVAILAGRASRRTRHGPVEDRAGNVSSQSEIPDYSNIEQIARFVAAYSHMSYENLRSASRRRVVSKAKLIAAVLSTRNGASVAAVARLFGRSRSTLIEQAERYRETQPQLFVHAERALEEYLQTRLESQCADPAWGMPPGTDVRLHGINRTEHPVRSLGRRQDGDFLDFIAQ
jgi:hypothetical protein